MRQISVKPYSVQMPHPDATTGTLVAKTVAFDVRGSMIAVLFGAGVNGRELLKRESLAKKIETAKATVLLEEEEYQTLLTAFRAWERFGRHEVELLRRIEEAPTVSVRPAKGARK
jgi:hypothetical protein